MQNLANLFVVTNEDISKFHHKYCRDRELSIPEYLGMFFFGFSFVICHSIIGYFSLYPDPAVLEAHLPMLK